MVSFHKRQVIRNGSLVSTQAELSVQEGKTEVTQVEALPEASREVRKRMLYKAGWIIEPQLDRVPHLPSLVQNHSLKLSLHVCRAWASALDAVTLSRKYLC